MSHLGPLISPLADGQLPPARAERAFAHVAGCDECRRALDAERASRAAARAAGEVRASPDLTARLLALQMPDVPLSGPSFPALASGAEPMRVTGWSEREHHPLRTRVMTGMLASVGLFALALFVLGGQQRPLQDPTALLDAGTTTPGATQFMSASDRHAATATEQRMSSALLEWVTASGWPAPELLPVGMSVSDVEVHEPDDGAGGAEVLEVSLVGASGAVTVLAQHGQLDQSMLAALEPVSVGGHAVYRVSGDWWLLECGGSVVAVSSGSNSGPAYDVIRSLPDLEDTRGVVDRLATGWTVLVSAF